MNPQAYEQADKLSPNQLREMFLEGKEITLYGKKRIIGELTKVPKEDNTALRVDFVNLYDQGNKYVGRASTLSLAYFTFSGTAE